MSKRRTATWIVKGRFAKCSKCGFWQEHIYDADNWQNYCGHCGKRMIHMIPSPRKAVWIESWLVGFIVGIAARLIARDGGGEYESDFASNGRRFVFRMTVEARGEYKNAR